MNDDKETTMSDTVPTKAAAEACETTPRLLRQFLRASKDYQAVGSGGRYTFDADDLPELKTRFSVWIAEREAAAKARAQQLAADAEKAVEEKATPTDDAFARLPKVADDAPLEPSAKPAARGRKTTAA